MQTSKRDVNAGFRRILYDAMVLSASLRVIRECKYYNHRRVKAPDIDGYVEAHQTNALIQIRSMIDFLSCYGQIQHDTMTVVQFFGCTQQKIIFPEERKAANKYAAHKSWDAVAKNVAAGARQLTKPKTVDLGMEVLGGFKRFWEESKKNLILSFNDYAERYKDIFDENYNILKKMGSKFHE